MTCILCAVHAPQTGGLNAPGAVRVDYEGKTIEEVFVEAGIVSAGELRKYGTVDKMFERCNRGRRR